MRASVHKVVSKVEMTQSDGSRVVKTEIHPEDGWVLVDGAPNVTIVEGFRVQHQVGDYAVTDWRPDDAIRVRVMREPIRDEIVICIDRERGGEWWPESECPTVVVHFDYPMGKNRRIRLSVKGGDLAKPVQIGNVALLPPAKKSAE